MKLTQQDYEDIYKQILRLGNYYKTVEDCYESYGDSAYWSTTYDIYSFSGTITIAGECIYVSGEYQSNEDNERLYNLELTDFCPDGNEEAWEDVTENMDKFSIKVERAIK